MPVSSFAEELKFVGTAYTAKDKKAIAYIEKHTRVVKDAKVLKSDTIYYDTSDKKLATLSCNYESSAFLPVFEFVDHRTGYTERLIKSGNKLKIEFQDSSKAKVETKEMPIKSSPSASQGLNELIKANLEKLYKKGDVETSFILPSRLDDIGMLITGKPNGADKVDVLIKVKNILFRIFAPQLEMTYSKKSGHLLRYFGNSNIMTESGDKQNVYIEYDYGPDE